MKIVSKNKERKNYISLPFKNRKENNVKFDKSSLGGTNSKVKNTLILKHNT